MSKNISVYRKAEQVTTVSLFEDIVASLHTFFPQYRARINAPIHLSISQAFFLFRDSDECINCAIMYEKDEALSLDAVIDVHEQLCSYDILFAGNTEAQIKLIFVAESFRAQDLKRFTYIQNISVSVYAVERIATDVGAYAYVMDDVYASVTHTAPKVQKQRMPQQQDIVDEPKTEILSREEKKTMRANLDEVVASFNDMPGMQGSAQDDVLDEEADCSHFFERSQLNDDEEKAFFDLHKELQKHSSDQ